MENKPQFIWCTSGEGDLNERKTQIQLLHLIILQVTTNNTLVRVPRDLDSLRMWSGVRFLPMRMKKFG